MGQRAIYVVIMDKIRLGTITIDCGDEQALCDFYHGLLGWEKAVLYSHPAVCSENGVTFLFIEEEDYVPPVWPEKTGVQQKQIHFDFGVTKVAVAVGRALALGATIAAEQFGDVDEFVTLTDPAGHPFCLCAESNSPN